MSGGGRRERPGNSSARWNHLDVAVFLGGEGRRQIAVTKCVMDSLKRGGVEVDREMGCRVGSTTNVPPP